MFTNLLKKSKFKDELDEILSECDKEIDGMDKSLYSNEYEDMNLKEVAYANDEVIEYKESNSKYNTQKTDYEDEYEVYDDADNIEVANYIEKSEEILKNGKKDSFFGKMKKDKKNKKEVEKKKLKKELVKELEVNNDELLKEMIKEREKLERELRQAGYRIDSNGNLTSDDKDESVLEEYVVRDDESVLDSNILQEGILPQVGSKTFKERMLDNDYEETGIMHDGLQASGVFESSLQDDTQEEVIEDSEPFDAKTQSEVEDEVEISVEEIEAIDILFALDEELKDSDERIKYIKDNCEQIINANKEIEDICVEYKIVASYISDIQKIEMSDNPDRKKLIETARKIESIVKDKEKLRQRSDKQLKVSQRTILERYEDNIVDEITNMRQYEKEHSDIKQDLSKLETEKNIIKAEKERAEAFQVFLGKMARGVVIGAGVLYLLFVIIAMASEIETILPIAITTVLGAAGTFYVIISSKKNEQELILNDKKMNKLIKILNKTKIKYVNSTKLVEYVRNKYDVSNSKELGYLWDRYLAEKDLRDKIFKNTEMLKIYLNIFKRELGKFDLDDVDVWKNQIGVIAHQEELATLKNNLDERRVDLKERIEYNNKLYEMGINNLRNIRNINLEYREEVDFLLDNYELNIREEF